VILTTSKHYTVFLVKEKCFNNIPQKTCTYYPDIKKQTVPFLSSSCLKKWKRHRPSLTVYHSLLNYYLTTVKEEISKRKQTEAQDPPSIHTFLFSLPHKQKRK